MHCGDVHNFICTKKENNWLTNKPFGFLLLHFITSYHQKQQFVQSLMNSMILVFNVWISSCVIQWLYFLIVVWFSGYIFVIWFHDHISLSCDFDYIFLSLLQWLHLSLSCVSVITFFFMWFSDIFMLLWFDDYIFLSLSGMMITFFVVVVWFDNYIFSHCRVIRWL